MLAIDLFCGLGGWTDGLLAEGWDVIGFDMERHRYPSSRSSDLSVKRPGLNWSDRTKRGSKNAQFNRPPDIEPDAVWTEYPAQLVLQDVLTLDGAQFRDADLIVASPPCQEFSYMAMPWSKAKAKIGVIEACPTEWLRLCALFDACFRIQREACAAAGRHIPLIVENVRGAQRWVGRSRWNFGSFHLWGDVPALMPMTARAMKMPDGDGVRTDKGRSAALANYDQLRTAIKNTGGSWFNVAHNTTSGKGRNPDGRKMPDGYPRDHPEAFGWPKPNTNSKSNARKAASAMIAKIPFALSSYIGRTFATAQTTGLAQRRLMG